MAELDTHEWELLTATLRKTMAAADRRDVDAALAELGWPELLAEAPTVAASTVCRLLGETGSHASVLDDIVGHAAQSADAGPIPLPFAGGMWVVWDRESEPGRSLDEELPLRTVATGAELPSAALAAGRHALGWWLLGTGHAMLTLARRHVVERKQFGRPLASFQAVRHRLAETLVALEGAEAVLNMARDDLGAMLGTADDNRSATPGTAGDDRGTAAGTADNLGTILGTADSDLGALPDHSRNALGAMLGKAAAGQAALTAARHCQQVLGGIGFTSEHDLHRHVRRTLVLDGLFGSTRELSREAGAYIRAAGAAPRLAQL
ncbi:acyl-CoA dehydrogenase family protein [Nocardia mexicana]|uniref:Acyl-CoA dehydrogenase-like protein n=1 Tax=Nocardia mexicana TaxID=279262 RepID=A0A370HH79_9NOCA|nr:acyl-CoA dehydrogenase family protein [Nocardia mexicana]RDI56130.1 acyl-CoA dehydrogenase-like protein [Nocardia mexicana]